MAIETFISPSSHHGENFHNLRLEAAKCEILPLTCKPLSLSTSPVEMLQSLRSGQVS
jgi:hypothetical protein